VLEQLADTFDDGEETERFLGTPLLALIPDASSGQSVAYGSPAPQLPQNASNGEVRDVKVPTVYGNGHVLGEAYRTLRTSLQLSRAGSHPRTTLITSALPREGKTTIAINTATVFAHTGSRVLLIDADLRKPRCHHVLGTSHYPGLTDVLIGARDLATAVQGTFVDNLFLLSSGQRPPNPSELLGSDKMKELLQKAIGQYDYVLLDSPPIAVVSDGMILAALVDGVMMVVRAGHTPKQLVRSLLARLEYVRARVFGVTLNRVKVTASNRMFYGDYYSGAHYGDDEDSIPVAGSS
jgi:capsular exopolysaccharide synthesis family protein